MRPPRIIFHLDLDAFFASVEERERPWLKGRPIVVGSDPKKGKGRGVVSTANYAARKYGIHSAMPITKAWQASENAKRQGLPEAVFISPTHRKYGEIGHNVAQIVKKYVPQIERAGVDELYGDMTFAGSYEKAAQIAKKIKANIKKAERLGVSVGIGPNKLIAKIASDFKKPDGLVVVEPAQVLNFLAPLPVRVVPGVGPKAEISLAKLKISRVEQARELSFDKLTLLFGVWGESLYKRIRGIDNSKVEESEEVKSVGEQETLECDTLDPSVLISQLDSCASDVIRRFKRAGFSMYQRVVITVRFEDFKTYTRSKTLPEPATNLKDLKKHAAALFMPFLDERKNPGHKLIRLVGVRIENLL